jgi:aspartate kinase
MSLIVQKYGGTSVANLERIRAVAERVQDTVSKGHRVAVVVSAMAGETNALVELAREAAGEGASPREVDVLLALGETKTIALLAMVLEQRGQPARSLTGGQMGMRTDSRILSVLDSGAVAVLAGFQGLDEAGNVTTLGRGGSDTSAVAVACALDADVCEIYTDVDGVYTADPNLVPRARMLERVSYEEMLELASLGTKVLQIRSVKIASQHGLAVHVRSSFHPGEGTWVTREEEVMERLIVSGVTHNRDEAKIRIRGVNDEPGVAAHFFTPLSEAGIVVDMIVQNLGQDGCTDMTFTVTRSAYSRALEITRQAAKTTGALSVEGDDSIAKVSVVGLGMKDHAGIASRMFEVLASEGINIQLISTSEIKISVVIEEKYTELAVRALHAALVEA